MVIFQQAQELTGGSIQLCVVDMLMSIDVA